MGRLDGRVAVVTGSGQGIGREIALALAREGCRLVLNSRTSVSRDDTRTAANTLAEFRAEGHRAEAVFCDAATNEGSQALLDAALSLGGIDILVNNAGGSDGPASIEETDDAMWDATLAANLRSQYRCSHLAVPHMRERGFGRIINIGSPVGIYGMAAMSAYAAAKAGSIGLTIALAVELAGSGITVNCLMPSAATERNNRNRAEREAITGRAVPVSPLRQPAAVAPAAAFLALDEAAEITGQLFLIAGGQFTHFHWPPSDQTLFKPGIWTLDELARLAPRRFGARLAPSPAPAYLD